jgi:hypothetical protein
MVDPGRTPLRAADEASGIPQLLEEYGYRIEEKAGTCFVKKDGETQAVFKAIGDGTVKKLVNTLHDLPQDEARQLVLNQLDTIGDYRKANKQRWDEEAQRESQADTIVKLYMSQKPDLFHDQHGTPFTRIEVNEVKKILPVKSRVFKNWLSSLLWQAEEKAPGNEALNSALNVLKAIALFEGEEHRLYNRVAPGNDGFWIDMADDQWRAIHVSANGWRIVDKPPILFKRYSHQRPLPYPEREGDPKKLLDFINIEDKTTKLVFIVTAISYLVPEIPHVIIVFYGIQGSGKTTAFKLLRRLIDPSAVEVLSMPWEERERVQQLDHHWCCFYDNITKLSNSASDCLCRAATGGGFTKRELFTDDTDVIYNFKRCVGLSGISIAAQRGDLLDRSLLVGLKDIPTDERRTEEELYAEFEEAEGKIFGGFLDTLVKACKNYPEVKPEKLFRMADFTRWGCAIAQALGETQEAFIEAYETKVVLQMEEAAMDSPLATVLLDYMRDREKWKGTPTELYLLMRGHAKSMGVSRRQKRWPKAPNSLTRLLNDLKPSLKALGLEVITGIREGDEGTRKIEINRQNRQSRLSEEEEEDDADGTDGTDDKSPTPNPEDVIRDAYHVVEMAGDGMGLPLFKQWMTRKGYTEDDMKHVWNDEHFEMSPFTIHLKKKEDA